MIREEIKSLNMAPRDLRKFGLVVGGVFALLGAWFLFRSKSYHLYFWIPGVLLMVLGMVFPRGLKQVYIGWMTLAFVLGMMVSTLLLTVFYFAIITPMGLVARCFGKDFLDRKWDANAGSYWNLRDRSQPRPTQDYEKQY